MEKMAMPCLKQELLHLHANNANMTAEESELEFLKVMHNFLIYIIIYILNKYIIMLFFFIIIIIFN